MCPTYFKEQMVEQRRNQSANLKSFMTAPMMQQKPLLRITKLLIYQRRYGICEKTQANRYGGSEQKFGQMNHGPTGLVNDDDVLLGILQEST